MPFSSGLGVRPPGSPRLFCCRHEFQSPSHRGLVCDAYGGAREEGVMRFNPLLIGAWSASAVRAISLRATTGFQSPSHRGLVCDAHARAPRTPGMVFQSPSHRGLVCDRRAAGARLRRFLVSIPFSSGLGLRRRHRPVLLPSFDVSIPFSSGLGLRPEAHVGQVTAVASFNPLLLGA